MRFALLSILLLFAGCNYNIPKQTEDPGDNFDAESGETPDFKAVASLVIGPKCLECHSNAGGNKGGTNLEGYLQVRALLTRINYRALIVRDMPAGGLNARSGKVLEDWINAGAPETVVITGEKPDPSLGKGPATWDKVRDKIFAKKCTACHGKLNPDAGLDVTDVKQVRANISKIFFRVKDKRDMPPEPIPTLTPVEHTVLSKWIDIGMPE